MVTGGIQKVCQHGHKHCQLTLGFSMWKAKREILLILYYSVTPTKNEEKVKNILKYKKAPQNLRTPKICYADSDSGR